MEEQLKIAYCSTGTLLVWKNGDRVWSKESILWAELEHI